MPETPPLPPSAPDAADATLVRPAAAPAAPPAEPTPPLFAGRYALTRLIGRGGMGTVYEARDTLVGDTVALKQLDLGQDAASADALERFRREVRLARRITHPHVARMHDLGTHEGKAFLTMEYVDGEDLRELLARRHGALPAVEAARIALAVCEGLAAAHATGVVHRDLKPANILVERGGRVVLTDFGIARALAEERASRTQGAIGTPLYMAPEQVAGESVDARADLYAVGLLLYELLTGQLPFAAIAESPWSAAIARLTQTPPDLRQNADIPLPLARLAHHCLERHPARRPQDAAEVAGALRDWLARAGPSTLPPPSTPRPESLSSVTARPSTPSLPGPRGLALLPLRFQGPADSAWLGEALTEALIDQLSRTRGLHVLGSGVVARFRDARDPRALGGELGVDWVVDGTMLSAGPSVRVSIRLLETRTGGQLWSGRFDGPADALEVQDRLGPRIAEELRVEGVLASWRSRVVPEALVLYRQAHLHVNREMRSASEGPGELLTRCLALAPEFAPALALHAMTSVRAWFTSAGDNRADAARNARESVEHALREAPELPESHLARGMLSAHEGDWRAAVIQVRMALDIAPYHPLSLQYLGSMQCEAGQPNEGLERLRLAHALVPGMGGALVDFARASALLGRMEDFQWAIGRLSLLQSHSPMVELLRVRIAAWRGDLDEVRRVRAEALVNPETVSVLTSLYTGALLQEMGSPELVARVEALLAQRDNARFRSMVCQFTTELLCMLGDVSGALGYFQQAADTALIDLGWVEQCPALQPLRALPAFNEGRMQVRKRVAAIWNT